MFALPPVAICHSRVIGGDVLFVQDENTPVPGILATLPVYTWAELLELLRIEMTPQELPAIHNFKVQFGGSLGESSPRPVRLPDVKTCCPACGSAAMAEGQCGWCGHEARPALRDPGTKQTQSARAEQGELFA